MWRKGFQVLRSILVALAIVPFGSSTGWPEPGRDQSRRTKIAARIDAPQVAASVDSNGAIVPEARPGYAVEQIGGGAEARPGSPCAGAAAMQLDEAKALVRKIAMQEDFYPDFVFAVAKVESQFNSVAVSGKGAFGLMQLSVETAARFKVDICDPAQNVLGGLRFLRDLHDHYKNPFFILAAYNAGEESLLQYRGVPPFPETVRFVAAVTNEFYEWPAATARQPVLARKATTQPKSAIIGKASAGWSEGFVMHFD